MSQTHAPTKSDISDRIPSSQSAPIVAALLVAVFAFQLNASMLSPALATMTKELHTTDAVIGLTQTAFFTAAALFSLFLPRWSDMIGRRKMLTALLVVTAVGCAISAASPNVGFLFVGRVIQGVAGAIVPICLITLHAQVPNEKQYAGLMAIITSINGGIAGVDALAGGWLAGTFGFRSIFWVMSAVAVVAVFAVRFATKETNASETSAMDWMGVIALVIAMAGILMAFNEIGKLADASWLLVAILVIVGAIGFVVFWKIETKSTHPLVATQYLKERRTWGLLLTTLLTMTGVFSVMNGLIPNFAQDSNIGPGISVGAVSWITLTPYALAGLIMGPIAGRIAGRIGYNSTLRIGQVGTIVGLAASAIVVHFPSRWSLLVLSIFVGVTYAGISNIMLNGLGVVLSPKDNQGYLPGMNSGAFNTGAGISYAVLFAVLTAVGQSSGPLAEYTASLVVSAVLLVLAFAASFLIPSPDGGTAEEGRIVGDLSTTS